MGGSGGEVRVGVVVAVAMLLGVWGMRKGLQVLLGGGCVCRCCVAVVRSTVSSAVPRIGRRGEGLVGDRKKWVGYCPASVEIQLRASPTFPCAIL